MKSVHKWGKGLAAAIMGAAVLGGAFGMGMAYLSERVAVRRLFPLHLWEKYDWIDRYAREHRGERYAQQDMIEDFCRETRTDDIHVPAIRREWQRRVKRKVKS